MYKNYIFDLYGTLIDIKTDENSKNFYKKYVKWLRKKGLHFEWKDFKSKYEYYEKMYRKNAMEQGDYANPEIDITKIFSEVLFTKGYALNDDELWYICEQYRNISLIHMSLFPDTIKCLEILKEKGKKIYLLSNAQKCFTWQELEKMNLIKYFDGILISSEEGCMKPDVAFFEKCCERYSLNKKESIMIGNELKSDILGAFNSGIDAYYLNRFPVFHPEEQPKYKYVSVDGSLMQLIHSTI